MLRAARGQRARRRWHGWRWHGWRWHRRRHRL